VALYEKLDGSKEPSFAYMSLSKFNEEGRMTNDSKSSLSI